MVQNVPNPLVWLASVSSFACFGVVGSFSFPSSLLLHAGSPIRVSTALAGPRGMSSLYASTPSPSRPLLSLLAASASTLGVSLRYRHSLLALRLLSAPGLFGSRCSSYDSVVEASVSFVIS